MFREYEDECFRLIDRVDDGLAPVRARPDVAWRDPAADTLGLQHGANGVGRVLVLGRIGDENVVPHGAKTYSRPLGLTRLRSREYAGFPGLPLIEGESVSPFK